MSSFSGFSDYIKGSHTIKMQLQIDNQPSQSLLPNQSEDKVKRKISLPPPYTIELPPAFSHMNLLLMEIVSGTQHGEFLTRSQPKNYQTMVELGGHMSHRYFLNKQEVAEIQQIYEQIIENWIVWRLANKKN